MIEARFAEFADRAPADEVERTIDRIVWHAGDRQALAGARRLEPGCRPVLRFTVRADGRRGCARARRAAALGLVTRLMPPLAGGNAVVVVASETRPIAAVELAEAIATSDVPGGVVNLLTGFRAELGPVLASHMDVNAIDLCGADGLSAELERLSAENVKRVVNGRADVQSPWEISGFLELKTVWHPVGQ